MSAGNLTVAPSGELEIVMTREFAAPRHLVWEAWTRPDLLKRWLLGPPGWIMEVCEVDLRVGGKYRYVWRHETDNRELGLGGVYLEIEPPGRLVATEAFDEPYHTGEAVSTILLVEHGGRTMQTNTMRCPTREARDGMLQSGMESGVGASYDRLDAYLASVV